MLNIQIQMNYRDDETGNDDGNNHDASYFKIRLFLKMLIRMIFFRTCAVFFFFVCWQCFWFSSANRYPFYAVQWHPEKSSFEWIDKPGMVHSTSAVRACFYTGSFFVSEGNVVLLYVLFICSVPECFLYLQKSGSPISPQSEGNVFFLVSFVQEWFLPRQSIFTKCVTCDDKLENNHFSSRSGDFNLITCSSSADGACWVE